MTNALGWTDMLDSDVKDRISNLMGASASSFVRVESGYSPAGRWIFRVKGQSYFAKIGTTEGASQQLRQEIVAYETIRGDFMPRLIAAEDHATAPLLVLEDLSDHYWPPPWRPGQIEAVLAQISQIHASSADLPTFTAQHGEPACDWPMVAKDTAPFLSLGLVSEVWLDQALPTLIEAEATCPWDGPALTHWDLRSDNICIGKQGIKLIDWNGACLGNPKLDLGFWLPSLAHEGGPEPESTIGDEPAIAVCVAGYFAARAGLPIIETAPRVRLVQRQLLVPALAWAARALDLPSSAI